MKRLKEAISLPIKVGDTILGGKFRNRKIVVKDISWDKIKGPLVNGKPLLKVRMMQKEKGMERLRGLLKDLK